MGRLQRLVITEHMQIGDKRKTNNFLELHFGNVHVAHCNRRKSNVVPYD